LGGSVEGASAGGDPESDGEKSTLLEALKPLATAPATDANAAFTDRRLVENGCFRLVFPPVLSFKFWAWHTVRRRCHLCTNLS